MRQAGESQIVRSAVAQDIGYKIIVADESIQAHHHGGTRPGKEAFVFVPSCNFTYVHTTTSSTLTNARIFLEVSLVIDFGLSFLLGLLLKLTHNDTVSTDNHLYYSRVGIIRAIIVIR
jgi:hypothetical protein